MSPGIYARCVIYLFPVRWWRTCYYKRETLCKWEMWLFQRAHMLNYSPIQQTSWIFQTQKPCEFLLIIFIAKGIRLVQCLLMFMNILCCCKRWKSWRWKWWSISWYMMSHVYFIIMSFVFVSFLFKLMVAMWGVDVLNIICCCTWWFFPIPRWIR